MRVAPVLLVTLCLTATMTACGTVAPSASPGSTEKLAGAPSAPDTRIERLYLKQVGQSGRGIRDAAETLEPIYLDTRAGTIELQAVAVYADGAEEVLVSGVAWTSSDSKVARVAAGMVTAASDGEATITASIEGDGAADSSQGSIVEAQARIVITGQRTNPYVTSLSIASQNDPTEPIAAYLNESEDVYDSYVAFYAIVRTFDPLSGTEAVYNTCDGTLYDQTEGRIADPVWSVADNDTSSAVVQDSSGTALFLPLGAATVELVVASGAGEDDTKVSARIDVVSRSSSGPVDPAIDHPQDSLSVYCYWEDYPPTDEEKKDPQSSDKFVIEAHYTPSEVADLGMHRNRYTLIRNARLGYSALYAQGPYLEELLSDVFFRQANPDLTSVSVDAVNSLTFFCYDGLYGRAVSGSYLMKTEEYYYPYIYTEDPSADAQLVKPEIALIGFKTADDDPEEYGDEGFFDRMDDANRFRLALGANLDSLVSNQQLAVKWINTIYVELKGGPTTASGDGEATVGDAEKGTSEAMRPAGEAGEGTGPEFRIYQVMNAFDPTTDAELVYSNPLMALAPVLATMAVLAGAITAVLYARQQIGGARLRASRMHHDAQHPRKGGR